MIVKTDREVNEDDFILGLITNSISIGGFKAIASKEVQLDDGKFEVVLIKMPKSLLELQGIIISLLGEKMLKIVE